MRICRPEKLNFNIGLFFIIGGMIFSGTIFYLEKSVLAPALILAACLAFGIGEMLFYLRKRILYDDDNIYYRDILISHGNYPIADIIAKKREWTSRGGAYDVIRLYDRNNKYLISLDDTYDGSDRLIGLLKTKSEYHDLDAEEEKMIKQGGPRLNDAERADLAVRRDATSGLVKYASIAAIAAAISPVIISPRVAYWVLMTAWLSYIGLLIVSSGMLFGNARTGMKNAWTILGEPQDRYLLGLIAVAVVMLHIMMIWFMPGRRATYVICEEADLSFTLAICMFFGMRYFFCRRSRIRIAVSIILCIFFAYIVYDYMEYDFAKVTSFDAKVTDKFVYEEAPYYTIRADEIRTEIRENELYQHDDDDLYVYECSKRAELLPSDSMSIKISKDQYDRYVPGDAVKITIHRAISAHDSYVEID